MYSTTHLDELCVLALLSFEQRVFPQDGSRVEAHLRALLGVLWHVRREPLVELELLYHPLLSLFFQRQESVLRSIGVIAVLCSAVPTSGHGGQDEGWPEGYVAGSDLKTVLVR